MSTRKNVRVHVLLAASSLIAHAASAQGAETQSRLRPDERCLQSAAKASSAPSAVERRSAIVELRQPRCRAVVVPALSRAWRSARAEDAEILRHTTAQVGDRRMADSLESVATDQRLPGVIRLNALAALVTYADPTAFAEFSNRIAAESVLIGSHSHEMQQPGEVPLTVKDRDGVLERMDRIAARTPDPQERAAAQALRRQLVARRSAQRRLRAGR